METAIFILVYLGIGFVVTVIEDNTEAILLKTVRNYNPKFHTPRQKILTIFLWPMGIIVGFKN